LIIQENIYCTIATSSLDGIPWITPVFFAYDEKFNIYWVSNKDSRHSTSIKENNKIAISIFNSQMPEGFGDGVYIEALVKELSEKKDIQEGIDVYNSRATIDSFRIPSQESVTGNNNWRIYKAIPKIINTTPIKFLTLKLPKDLA
jgi:uncharacterized protein YhbP (UPF0306 family)